MLIGLVRYISTGCRSWSFLACFIAVAVVPEVPKGLLAYGRTVERWPTIRGFHFVSEGLDSPVVVSESGRVSLFPCGRKSRGNEQPQRHAARNDCSAICRRWCIRLRGPRWSSAVGAV